VTLDELYAQSDVITLHCPLTDETKGMIDDRGERFRFPRSSAAGNTDRTQPRLIPSSTAFDKMRDGVILINTSRGAVVCEPSLVRALESGKVLRAALDVYAEEPVVHPGLIANDRTLLLPHVAVVNETMYEDMQTEILDNLEEFVRTGRARTPVTEPRQEEMRWKGLGGA
jgi:phosphoglycerate dehydrogenase-like enzyme